MKLNSLIVQGLAKNMAVTTSLRHFQIVNYRFTHHAWEQLGNAIGKCKTLLRLILPGCNLNGALEVFIKGLIENESLEKIDLSDNQIKDSDGLFLVRYVKLQAERRENALWQTGLRHHDVDNHAASTIEKSISHEKLTNIVSDNHSLKLHILRQNHYNHKKDKIKNRKGLRELILKRNNLAE